MQLECQSVIADPQDQQANRNLESRSDSENPNTEEKYKIKTKLAKAVEAVLGPHFDTIRFDKLRQKVKNCPGNKHADNSYKDMLAVIQVKISKAYGDLRKELDQWEKLFSSRHDLSVKLKHAKALLKAWDMDF